MLKSTKAQSKVKSYKIYLTIEEEAHHLGTNKQGKYKK